MGTVAKVTAIRPYFYVNVHQTILAGLAVVCVAAYIFDFKGARTSFNEAVKGMIAR